MISRIENPLLRRAVLVVALPILFPAALLLEAAAAVYDEARLWPDVVRRAW